MTETSTMAVASGDDGADERASDLRERILAEATRLFAERGYGATSVREVVEGCGCTKPALYYYFRSKEALYLAAIAAQTRAVTRLLEVELDRQEGRMRERMAQGMHAFLAHVERNPRGMRLLLRADLQPEAGAPRFDFDSVRQMHLEMLVALLAAGQKTGEIRVDIDLMDAAYALSGMVDQRLILWLMGQPIPKDLPERVLPIFFDGVSP